jgi:D-serine deaminase-like pyridoxal phosphate-dependent protein
VVTTDPALLFEDVVMAQMPAPHLAAAIAELRQRPITGTDKGFGVPAPGARVSAASLGAERPSLFGPGFTMPVLVLRESAVAHNIGAMAAYCAAAGVRLAPHGKTTMAPQLFARQLAAGAWAVTAATVGELQVYRAFGIPRVLLANELTDPAGAAWLAGELAADPGFDCYVYADSPAGVALLDEAVRQAGPARPLPVLVELGYPGGRTGCRGLAAAEAVARAVAQAGSLRLAGVAGYEGLIGHDRSPQTVGAIAAYCRELRSLGELLAAGGLVPDELILSAGGSAFFDVVVRELAPDGAGRRGRGEQSVGRRDRGQQSVGSAPVVVLRSGVYIAFDHGLYAGLVPGPPPALAPALELWAHVLSRPEPGLALACAGRRDVAFDAGLPVPLRIRGRDGSLRPATGMRASRLDDQHCYLQLADGTELEPGEVVCFGVSHPCTTFDKWRVIPVVDDDYRVVDAVHTFF